jgi:hypothetical protein
MALARPAGAEQVEVAPAGRADDADAAAAVVDRHGFRAPASRCRAPRSARAAPARRRRGRGRRTRGCRRRTAPAAASGEALEAAPLAVDVAGEDQELGAGRRLRVELLGLEVQVGEELQPHLSRPARRHGGAPAAPWQTLYLRPLPHGHGSLRPTLGAARRTVSTW